MKLLFALLVVSLALIVDARPSQVLLDLQQAFNKGVGEIKDCSEMIQNDMSISYRNNPFMIITIILLLNNLLDHNSCACGWLVAWIPETLHDFLTYK